MKFKFGSKNLNLTTPPLVDFLKCVPLFAPYFQHIIEEKLEEWSKNPDQGRESLSTWVSNFNKLEDGEMHELYCFIDQLDSIRKNEVIDYNICPYPLKTFEKFFAILSPEDAVFAEAFIKDNNGIKIEHVSYNYFSNTPQLRQHLENKAIKLLQAANNLASINLTKYAFKHFVKNLSDANKIICWNDILKSEYKIAEIFIHTNDYIDYLKLMSQETINNFLTYFDKKPSYRGKLVDMFSLDSKWLTTPAALPVILYCLKMVKEHAIDPTLLLVNIYNKQDKNIAAINQFLLRQGPECLLLCLKDSFDFIHFIKKFTLDKAENFYQLLLADINFFKYFFPTFQELNWLAIRASLDPKTIKTVTPIFCFAIVNKKHIIDNVFENSQPVNLTFSTFFYIYFKQGILNAFDVIKDVDKIELREALIYFINYMIKEAMLSPTVLHPLKLKIIETIRTFPLLSNELKILEESINAQKSDLTLKNVTMTAIKQNGLFKYNAEETSFNLNRLTTDLSEEIKSPMRKIKYC